MTNYQLWIKAVLSQPIAIVSTRSKNGTVVNLAPSSFFTMVHVGPSLFVFGLVSPLDKPKDMLHNLQETGECVIKSVPERTVEAVNAADINSPYGVSEWVVTAGFNLRLQDRGLCEGGRGCVEYGVQELAGQGDKNMSRIRKSRNRPPPDKRRRTYAAAEAKEAYVRDSERSRSRSPALAQDRQPDRHYRDRSPLRDDEVTDWLPPRSHGRQIASHKNGGVRCYACNETGHKAIDCKGAAGGLSSYSVRVCFHCGELDHIARECTVRVGQIKTDADIAAGNGRFQQPKNAANRRSWPPAPDQKVVHDWGKGVRGDRWVPQEAWDEHSRNESFGDPRQTFRSPHKAGSSNDRFEQYRNARGDAEQHWSRAVSSSARAIEDEVDWDDDALDAGDAANGKMRNAPQKMQRESHSNVLKQLQGPRLYATDAYQMRQPMTKESTSGAQMAHARDERERSQELRPETTKEDPRSSQEDDLNAPPTAYDLRGYDYHIHKKYTKLPRSQRFVNGGNGKVAPARYGSEQLHDFGLCFTTFLTKYCCEMGLHCPWRHHPLSATERAWITEYGKYRGKEFLDNVDRCWAFPEIPVPAATMHGLGDD
ncbi:hypothetical protein DDE83_005184 [Stemphylium lycopersici]|uniref:CCHC-type domain-containing protein n=1 Tax=Stemphylium lycopersici TaxID=183478 RepID=A0A364N2F6_STELY|nr:hypothetical protein DDE83_005184 [Stemphylium lycopersici]